jgi:hypothetical protein
MARCDVGGGFAGLACARNLAKHPDVRVTLIDKHNYHQFQPLLYQLATGEIGTGDLGIWSRTGIVRSVNIGRIQRGSQNKNCGHDDWFGNPLHVGGLNFVHTFGLAVERVWPMKFAEPCTPQLTWTRVSRSAYCIGDFDRADQCRRKIPPLDRWCGLPLSAQHIRPVRYVPEQSDPVNL